VSASDFKHRLAAILAADAAGYSRLMAGNDRATVLMLDAARAVFRKQIELNRGRVIDMAGDSILAVFDTAAGAVVAALAVQHELEAASDTTPEDHRMRFRIGVHLGDVIEKLDGSVYGDGVNIAARLQGLAEPGGIMVSDMVHGAVRDRITAEFEDAGQHNVKNIPRPVRSYRVQLEATVSGGLRVAAAGKSPHAIGGNALPQRPSLAVLPFTNMSGDSEQEYFADGITEDIITDVSKISGLFVIARNSSFTFKKQNVDIKDVGRKLGVRHVLEGSVRKVGMKVRINVQLIDAESGGHVWAERFDRDLEDIFVVQDEVTRRIVDALKVTLQPAERVSLGDSRTSNIEAHDCFLRGRELMVNAINKNREFFDSVVAAFRRAIELDPGYAEPYAGLGMAYCLDFQNRWANTPDALNVAAQFAAQAIERGPSEPYAHYVAAVVSFWKRDLVRAKSETDEALALNPNYALAYGTRGLVEIYLGHPLAAIPFIQRAILLDPVFTQQYMHFLGSAYLVAGQFETAAATFRERIRLAPKTDLSRAFLACALGHLGEIDEARRVWNELKDVNPKYSLAEHLARLPFQNYADLDGIREGLTKAGLPD
jgi:adenylate cyclase